MLIVSLVYGQAEWSPPVRISERNQGACYPSIIAIGDTLHVVYGGSTPYVVYVRSTDEGLTWSNPNILLNNPGYIEYARVIGYGSNIMCLWEHQTDVDNIVYCTSSNNGTTWSGTHNVIVNGCERHMHYAVSNYGSTINISFQAPYYGFDIYYVTSTNFGQTWSSPRNIIHASIVSGVYDNISFGNSTSFVWDGYLNENQTHHLYHCRSTDGGVSWLNTILDEQTQTNLGHQIRLAVNQFGNIGAVWIENDNVKLKQSSDWGTTWDSTIQVTSDCMAQDDGYCDIAYDYSNIYLVWERSQNPLSDELSIYFNKSFDYGQTWDSDYWINRNSYRSMNPSLAVSKGKVYAVWLDCRANSDTLGWGIYFSYWPYYAPDAVSDNQENIPTSLSISAYPNPFNFSTTLSLGNYVDAEIGIYDITGKLVEKLKADKGQAVWDAAGFSSGIYFARAQEGNSLKSIKLILLK